MANYWAIAPWPSNKQLIFEQVCRYDRDHGVIAIGWDNIDVTGLSWAEVKQKVIERYPDSPGGAQALWDFYNRVQPGDIFLVKRGQKFCVGVGEVASQPWHDSKLSDERTNGLTSERRSNFIRVLWKNLHPVPFVPRHWFPRKTLTRIDPVKYIDVLERVT
jgi:hypothetical protein